MPDPPLDAELRVLTAGSAQVLPEGALRERLQEARRDGRPLRVKLGIDPSSPHLHLGHTVVLRKLAQFQRFGHTVVLIIGTFTGLVGDPTGRSEARILQTEDVVATNIRTYLAQVSRILDVDAAEIRYNAEWLAPLTFADVARLAANVTVAQLLERDDFRARYRAGQPISLVEFLYPLMQGMDSVAVRADVELGGTDQTFNLLVGRELQRAHGQPEQIALTLPLLEGLDGVQKMGKSLGNTVDIDEPPEVQFGKLMTLPDALVGTYAQLCTDLGPDESKRLGAAAVGGGRGAVRAKREMAKAVVAACHGAGAAEQAEEAFDAGVRVRAGAGGSTAVQPSGDGTRGAPGEGADAGADVLPELAIPTGAITDGKVWVVALLAEAGLVPSRSHARRLVRQGAVRLDAERVGSEDATWSPGELDGRLLTVGRRSPLRLRSDVSAA